MAIRSALKQPAEKCPENPGGEGLVITMIRRDCQQDCPQVSKPPVRSVGTTPEERLPSEAQAPGSDSQDNQD